MHGKSPGNVTEGIQDFTVGTNKCRTKSVIVVDGSINQNSVMLKIYSGPTLKTLLKAGSSLLPITLRETDKNQSSSDSGILHIG